MLRRKILVLAMMAVALGAGFGSRAALCADDVKKGELLAPPTVDVVKTKLLDWLTAQGFAQNRALVDEIQRLWIFEDSAPNAEAVHDTLVKSFCLADSSTRQFVDQLTLPNAPLIPPDIESLGPEERGSFYLSNMRLCDARYLIHREMFEEALEALTAADLKEVADPASFLFFKASCEKRLSLNKEGLASLNQLLNDTEGVPVRYSTVAALMKIDLEAMEEKSLNDISWKMEDVERRLRLARAGEKTQKVEGEIVSLLDEIIKKIEEQSGGGGGGAGAGNPSNQSSSPAQDSTIKGSTAPGKVDPKKFKSVEAWGNLTEKERAKVKNLISRDFPAHYRQAVEEYFKKLATREANPK